MKINIKTEPFNPILFSLMGFLMLLPMFQSLGIGCSRNKKDLSTIIDMPATTALSADQLQKRTETKADIDISRLYTHLSGAAEGGQMGGMDFSGNLYWVKDSMIWLSLRKFGFEGMRVKLTPDSCFVLNRLEKTVLIRDASWLESQYGITDGFAMLQSLLLNEPKYLPKAEKTAAIQDSLHLLTQRDGDRVLRYFFSEGNYRLQRAEMNELRRQISVSCLYAGWAAATKQAFASRQRDFQFYSPEQGNMQLRLDFKDVIFDQIQAARFEIPDHYERN
jgi:hypothetical protein